MKALDIDTADKIRDFVKNGGGLLATGITSIIGEDYCPSKTSLSQMFLEFIT